MFDLEAMKNVDIETVNRSDLTDLQTVHVGSHFTGIGRIAEFIRQLGNPYCFIAGKYIMKTRYSDDGPPMEDCVRGIFF